MADITINKDQVIRQIKTSDSVVYTIDAPLWEGRRFSEIESMIHGVVDTYVIPAQTDGTEDYKAVVESANAQVSISTNGLNTLTSSNTNNTYKVGDVILMGATSDGTNNFDRWVSKVEGDTIYLDVLETQVATHHHTIGVSYSNGNALTGISTSSNTTYDIATVGSTVEKVLTGESGSYVTSIDYSDKEADIVTLEDDLAIATATSENGVGHKHSIAAHSHTVKFKPSSMVSQNVSAYTSLTSANYTPHKHSVVSVAGAFESDSSSAFTYVYDKESTDSFIKTLTDASSTTDTGGATPDTNEVGLETTTQTSTDVVGDIVKTQSAGGHTHTATTTVTTSVVVSATVQSSVMTSVSWSITKPTVQSSVVTSWVATVESETGILSFEAPRASQSAGSTTIKASRASQSRSYGTPTITTTISEDGAHQHGFSHTHTIADHKHTVDSHTHTYYKTVASATGSAITALSTATYTPHKHTNISAAGVQTDDSEAAITYVTGGDTTEVVQNMKNTEQSCTVENNTAALETDTKYYKITGEVKFPGLTVGTKTIGNTSITPAVDTGETAIRSITFTSSNFITGVSLVSGNNKTSPNIGGE
jgi:hypothetical protein